MGMTETSKQRRVDMDLKQGSTRNKQATSNRDWFEADSIRNEQATSSRNGFEAGSTRNEQAIVEQNQQTK